MNSKNKKLTLLLALPVIAAITLIPMATGDVFAENANTDVAKDRIATTDVARDALPTDSLERMAEAKFRGETNGWAIIGGQAFESKIGISGTAVHQVHGEWKVRSEGEIAVADKHAKLELTGNAFNGHLRLHGTGTLDTGEPFRIFLRGHFAPVYDQQGDFVVAFTTAKIHTLNDGVKIPLIQDGIVHVEPVDPSTDDYTMFLEEFDVVE
jgi:hypothetical protein